MLQIRCNLYFVLPLVFCLTPFDGYFVKLRHVIERFPNQPRCKDMYIYALSHGGKHMDNGSDSQRNNPYRLSFDDLKANVANFIKSLRQRSEAKTASLSRYERADLLRLFQHLTPTMSGTQLVATATAAGLLHESLKLGSAKRDVLLIHMSKACAGGSLTASEVAALLVAAARLELSWTALSSRENGKENARGGASVEKALTQSLSQMSPRGVCDAVWAMGATGARVGSLTPKLRSAVLTAVSAAVTAGDASASMSVQQLPSLLWALAKMGVRWSQFSDFTRTAILRSLRRHAALLTAPQASKAVWAIGSLGVTMDELPQGFITAYLQATCQLKKSKMGYALGASQTLVGLAKLGARWEGLAQVDRGVVWEQVTRVCQGSNYQGLANSLWALGSLGVQGDGLPSSVSSALWSGVESALAACSGWELSNIIWSLSRMYPETDAWTLRLSENVRRAVDSAVQRLYDIDGLNPVDVAVILWSMGSLGVPLDNSQHAYLRECLLFSLMRTLPDMRATETAKILWGLGGCGQRWDDLPVGLQWQLNAALRREESNMSVRELSNAAYATALLCFDSRGDGDGQPAYRGVHEVLTNAVLNAIERDSNTARCANDSISIHNVGSGSVEETEQLRIFLHYVSVIQLDVTRRAMIPRGLAGLSARPMRARLLTDSSQLQVKVVRGLQEALNYSDAYTSGRLRVATEYSSFDQAFPVDAAVLVGEWNGQGVSGIGSHEPLCLIEVDGPHHYRPDGKIRRKDLLKELMYTRRHPYCIFRRVRWDEAWGIGVEAIGTELSAMALKSHREANPLSRAWNSMKRGVDDWLKWGLRNTRVQ